MTPGRCGCIRACGVVRIGRSELEAWASQSKSTIHVTVFDRSDGVTSHRLSAGYNSVVAKSSDGKLWFVRNVGLSVIDPHHLAFNKLPPPVHVERVTADDKIYDATNGLRLPPCTRNVAIDYTALSFAAPEKVRFRSRTYIAPERYFGPDGTVIPYPVEAPQGQDLFIRMTAGDAMPRIYHTLVGRNA